MGQVINTNKGVLSNLESIAGSKADLDIDEKTDLFDLDTNTDQDQLQEKKEKKISQTDATKCVKLPNEILDFIYIAQCQRLFSLAWYNNMTYAQNKDTKELPVPCCNDSSCNLVEPDFIYRELFIDLTNPSIIETD